MSFWEKVANFFKLVKVRNRDEDGRYVADDKPTEKLSELVVIELLF